MKVIPELQGSGTSSITYTQHFGISRCIKGMQALESGIQILILVPLLTNFVTLNRSQPLYLHKGVNTNFRRQLLEFSEIMCKAADTLSSSLWKSVGTIAWEMTACNIRGLIRSYSKLLVQGSASCPRQPISPTNGI